MIMAGKNIRQKNDPMQHLSVERLYKSIIHPKPEIAAQINQLRSILAIDKNKYRELKTRLPYVCCGNFEPKFRKTENFGSIESFIIDIDHLNEKEIDINTLKNKLKQDPRIELMFTSPSNDGLKVFFRLSKKCYDPGQYSLFYKTFALAFSQQYNLSQVIDKSTSDVTRACFISYDTDAYFNENPQTININDFVNFEDLNQVRETEMMFKQQEKEAKQQSKQDETEKKEQKITDEQLEKIKEKLGSKIKTKKQKNIYVPEELEPAIEKVKNHLANFDIQTTDVINIHYGKKFQFQLGNKKAEINLFYGRKGYTVVKTTKSGTDAELNDICYQLMCEIFY